MVTAPQDCALIPPHYHHWPLIVASGLQRAHKGANCRYYRYVQDIRYHLFCDWDDVGANTSIIHLVRDTGLASAN